MTDNNYVTSFVELLDEETQTLLVTSGSELIKKIGIEVARSVVLDVLSGHNLRDSTEMLTRRRLALLNAATVRMMVKGISIQADFIERLPEIAARILA